VEVKEFGGSKLVRAFAEIDDRPVSFHIQVAHTMQCASTV
jgi:hypothetical protein